MFFKICYVSTLSENLPEFDYGMVRIKEYKESKDCFIEKDPFGEDCIDYD